MNLALGDARLLQVELGLVRIECSLCQCITMIRVCNVNGLVVAERALFFEDRFHDSFAPLQQFHGHDKIIIIARRRVLHTKYPQILTGGNR